MFKRNLRLSNIHETFSILFSNSELPITSTSVGSEMSSNTEIWSPQPDLSCPPRNPSPLVSILDTSLSMFIARAETWTLPYPRVAAPLFFPFFRHWWWISTVWGSWGLVWICPMHAMQYIDSSNFLFLCLKLKSRFQPGERDWTMVWTVNINSKLIDP